MPLRAVAVYLPLAGTAGMLALLGWRVGPWLPLGLVAAAAAVLGFAWWTTRTIRQVARHDPAAAASLAGAQAERIGRRLAGLLGAWMLVSLVAVALILIDHILG